MPMACASSRRAHGVRAILLGIVLCGPGLPNSAMAEEECVSWPGEPAPLATTRDDDFRRARWAALRADELARIASPLEVIARVDAHRIWRHVRCLDPAHAAAPGGLARTEPLRVHRPDVSPGAATQPDPADTLQSAFDRLDRALKVALPRAPATTVPAPARPPIPAPAPAIDLGEPARLAGEADLAMKQARFEDALSSAARARSALPAAANSAEASALRARIEASAGAAAVALGDEAQARESFVRALNADPGFRLDPAVTSPKVMRAFDAARNAARAR